MKGGTKGVGHSRLEYTCNEAGVCKGKGMVEDIGIEEEGRELEVEKGIEDDEDNSNS
jgi:hypothetical protein